MLDITYSYTCKYRYVLNASKSFCDCVREQIRTPKTFHSFTLAPMSSPTHTRLNTLVCIWTVHWRTVIKWKTLVEKRKASFFSILSVRLHPDYVNPLTTATLVHKVCIPTLTLWSWTLESPHKLGVSPTRENYANGGQKDTRVSNKATYGYVFKHARMGKHPLRNWLQKISFPMTTMLFAKFFPNQGYIQCTTSPICMSHRQ